MTDPYASFTPPHENEIATADLAGDRADLAVTAGANPDVRYYVRYRDAAGDAHYGEIEGDRVHRLTTHYFAEPARTGDSVALADVRLLAPLDPNRVSKVIGVAFNTINPDLASVAGNSHPRWFSKFPSSITGPGGGIEVPEESTQLIHEAEVVLVIGRTTRDVSVEEASASIWGVTAGNDLTELDWIGEPNGREGPPRLMAKACDTFAAIGPAIAVGLDYRDLSVTHRVDGEISQQGGSGARLQSPAELVSHLSRFLTLVPGDIIYAGATPFVPEATRIVRPGQELTVEIAGVGTLRNRAVKMSGRPWR